MEENTTDLKDLKIQALLEKISATVAQYENQDADRRVEITILGNQLRAAQEELHALRSKDTTHVEEDQDQSPS